MWLAALNPRVRPTTVHCGGGALYACERRRCGGRHAGVLVVQGKVGAMAPVLVVYIFAQKWVVGGVMRGAVK